MSTYELQALLQRVREESVGRVSVCEAAGHDWVSEGGRCCPKDIRDDCSQAVYRCRTCGIHDYGQPGGPGANDCEHHCPGADMDWIGRDDVEEQVMGEDGGDFAC
jgi:hypothetical protein